MPKSLGPKKKRSGKIIRKRELKEQRIAISMIVFRCFTLFDRGKRSGELKSVGRKQGKGH